MQGRKGINGVQKSVVFEGELRYLGGPSLDDLGLITIQKGNTGGGGVVVEQAKFCKTSGPGFRKFCDERLI